MNQKSSLREVPQFVSRGLTGNTQSAEFDLAILDLNIHGQLITPVADLIKARGCPIIFATGYGSEGLAEEFRDFPCLQKPYRLGSLAALIDEIMHPRAS